MNRITLAALAATSVLFAVPALAQQPVDWDKIQIKTTDLGNKTYRLEGQGGNITIAVGSDGTHHGGHAVRPALREDHGGDQGDLAAADQVCNPDPLPWRPHRRRRELPEGRRHRSGAGQHPHPAHRRHHQWHHRQQDGAAVGRRDPEGDLCRRHEGDRGRRPQGDPHSLLQRPHRRRHRRLFPGRQRDRHRRHHEQQPSLSAGRLRSMAATSAA